MNIKVFPMLKKLMTFSFESFMNDNNWRKKHVKWNLTYRFIAFLLRFDLLYIIRWEPMLPLASIVTTPPSSILFVHVRDDSVFAKRQFIFLSSLIIVNGFDSYLKSEFRKIYFRTGTDPPTCQVM